MRSSAGAAAGSAFSRLGKLRPHRPGRPHWFHRPHRPGRPSLAGIRGGIRSGLSGLGGGIAAIPARLVGLGRDLANRPVALVVVGAILIVAVVGSTVAYVSLGGAGDQTPSPSDIALASLEPTATPTLEPTATPTLEPTATPIPSPTEAPMVAATTDGVWLPADKADVATRKPIAVMIDDHWGARPQSGLSMADIVYQGPAEGGIPRYMAIFQTQVAPAIGPVRSSREYFVAWAEEYRAIYAHMWGAPNAMARLAKDDKKYIFNIDGLRYGGKSGYMWRVGFKVAPHNLYTSYAKLWTLGQKLGAKNPLETSPFTFGDASSLDARPIGGTITVGYRANTITYVYDRATNTYPRTVSAIKSGSARVPQVDAINQQRIAPSNVVIMTMTVGFLACSGAACHKNRLDVDYVGHGNAMVFNNGQAIAATWTKKNQTSTTVITYRDGPNKGQPVPMVRGQIFVQIQPTDVPASWTTGYSASPETDPLGN